MIKVWEGTGLYKTYDYSMFRMLEYNRDIDHERKIENSFLEIGEIPIPIVVNEKNEVIDGQHRFVVCKKLGLPVFYVIVPGLSIKQCGTINSASKTWTAKNIIHAYTSPEYEDNDTYILYELLNDEFKKIRTTMMSDILAPIYKTSGRGVRSMLTKQKLKITESDYEHFRGKCEWFEGLLCIQNKLEGSTESLWEAISYAYEIDKIDNSRLIKQVIKNISSLTPVGNFDTSLKDLERVYNKGKTKNKVYLQVEYDKYIKGKADD